MRRPRSSAGRRIAAAFGLLLATASAATAQRAAAATFTTEEIDQLVAPIALYPDALLAQVFMASTYPLEVVEAARFAKDSPDLEGDALDRALQDQTWDASVKSLVSFPQVLAMMNDKLDWTQKLGDAFLAQQSDVMDGVQRLRARAKAEGNLESGEQQEVVVEPAPAPPPEAVVEQAPTTIIKIEPTDPQIVYVPTYNPTVVYGPWPYPAYPPYYWYPPGYVAGGVFWFGVGVAVGSSLWGGCHWGWGHGDIDIDINRYNSFNRNVTRNFDKTTVQNKFQDGKWRHDASHRKGVQYRDEATQQRFDRAGRPGVDSREAFRGRAEAGRQEIRREGADKISRDLARSADARQSDRAGSQRPGAGAAQQRPSATRERAGASQRAGSSSRSHVDRGRGSGAFQGIGQGSQVRRDSSRGRASRGSAGRMGSRGGMRGGGGRR